MLAIRLDAETERRLEAMAARTGRSANEHVREAVLSHLEDMEDRELAEERLKHPARRWTLDEVERELDLER